VNRHHIHLIKSPRASWAFTHAVADSTLDATAAKDMSARLQSRVLEVLTANRAERKRLHHR
jgi:hypothetical protein